MPRKDSGMTQITLPAANRDLLMQFKLTVAAQIGRDFSMGNFIPVLVELAQRHEAEIIEIAREKL